MRAIHLLWVLLLSSPAMAEDFSTPEAAIVSLETAYREQNIEKAIKAKDFQMEARLMLEEMSRKNGKGFYSDGDLVTQTAEILELSFRAEIKKNGFPDFSTISCKTPKKERYKPDVNKILEVCRFPDGGFSRQWLLVGKTSAGWRVLNPL